MGFFSSPFLFAVAHGYVDAYAGRTYNKYIGSKKCSTKEKQRKWDILWKDKYLHNNSINGQTKWCFLFWRYAVCFFATIEISNMTKHGASAVVE